MANSISTINANAGVFAKAVALAMENECHFTKAVEKVPPSEFDGKNGIKSGNKVNFTIPARKTPVNGFDITSADKDVTDETVSMTLDIKKTIPFSMTSEELATDVGLKASIERYAKRYASDMSQVIEQEHLARASKATYNLVGTAGSTSYTVADVLAARTKLNKYLAPKDMGRHLLFDSEAGAQAVDARKGLFQSASNIAEQYKNGLIGRADGFNWHETELTHTHTNGSQGGTPLVDTGAAASGDTTLHIDGVTSGNTWTEGTVFTVAGVFAVNPITKDTYTHLQQFVVTADTTFTGGEADVPISPAIISTGTKQNISALPADNAAITVQTGTAGTGYAQSLAFHKEAFRVCSMPLELPKNAEFAGQYTTKAGLTVQVIRDYDLQTREFITRLDYYGGFVAIRPEWSTRITA